MQIFEKCNFRVRKLGLVIDILEEKLKNIIDNSLLTIDKIFILNIYN